MANGTLLNSLTFATTNNGIEKGTIVVSEKPQPHASTDKDL